MTTKEQELKALEQIKKILAGLDADGWVATAFEGCAEDAEENIQNDFALSMKSRFAGAQKTIEAAALENAQLKEENAALLKRAEEAERIANLKIASADKWCADFHEAYDKGVELTDRVEELEQEVMKLKAKLYDYMTGAAH